MTSQCLCAGPYPSIEQQAFTLFADPDMPRFPIEHYVAICEAVNSYLVSLLIEQARRSIAAMLAKHASKDASRG
jgi:hypothetical protein